MSKKKCCSCCDKENKTCCDRTAAGWGKLLVYHFLFLATIMGMLVLFIFAFKRSFRENPTQPAITKLLFADDYGPGATIEPTLDNKPIIYYKLNGSRQSKYVGAIESYIAKQLRQCTYISKMTGRSCKFNVTEFGPCGVSPFGYDQMKPCVFLKMNKIAKWAPEAYGSMARVPSDVDKGAILDPTRYVVYISCKPYHNYDSDAIKTLYFYPTTFFNENYFPMPLDDTNPTVAIQVDLTRRTFITQLRCSLYAKNIRNFNTKMFFYIN